MWVFAHCEHVREQLSALDEGDLGVLERLRIRGHLAMCRTCASISKGLRATRDALTYLRDDTA